ncbi:CapA family protein [Oceanobacillus sp. CAU 1775]
MKVKSYLLPVVLLLLLITGCGNAEISVIGSDKEISERQYESIEKDYFPVKITNEITISSIGDVLIHRPVALDAWNGAIYDFYPMLEKMKPYLSKSTITIANQESMIGGIAHGLSSYPSFNSPQEVGDALKAVGVDAVVLANNHTLDRGEAVVQSALQHWKTLNMIYAGAYSDFEDQSDLRIIETDEDISVALLSYTYGTNGVPVPQGKEYLVNLINREKIAEEVDRAKDLADAIVLQLHFGNEYERTPTAEQKELAQFAADLGVHAVIGHHPHVLQPVEWLNGEEGNETLVIYSLGNFLSNQQELYQRIGGVFTFTVEKTTYRDETTVRLHSPSLLPTYAKFDPSWSNYEIVPMHQLADSDLAGASAHYTEIKAHMSQWMPELLFPED